MVIYNTTYHVDLSVVDAFLEWIKGYYLPLAVKSGDLSLPRLALIMAHEDGDNHKSYSLQFEVDSIDVLQCWYGSDGKVLVEALEGKFVNKVVGFSTIMSVVDL